jgi:SAM-dependent methyltransferase
VTETFPREVAAHPEPFTGERLTSALSGQTQIEHYHRYLFARAQCRGLDVLDVASGEGYGSALLAQVARSVVGLDYSASTVRSAITNFPRSNLTFLQGDARALPLRDRCVDAVVSFETIEHFDRQDDFVAEVRRVLRPDGFFIVSTPDRDIYSAPGMQPNPFHVQEMSRPEFVARLGRHFRCIAILSQRPVIGSALLADEATVVPPPLVFDRRGQEFEASAGLPRAPYLVAIGSDRPLPSWPASLFIDRSDLDSDAIALADRTAALADSAAALAERSAALADCTAELAALRAAKAEAAAQLAAANTQITLLTRELALVRGSLRDFLRGYLPRLGHRLLGRSRR